MNESERKQIIQNLKDIKDMFEVAEEIKRDLEKLKETPEVKKYLELCNNLTTLRYDIRSKSKEKLKNLSFNDLFREEIEKMHMHQNEYKNFSRCSHPIWIYLGSFKTECNYGYQSKPYGVRLENENSFGFEYNKYKCPECGREEITKDYKAFENEHSVLKSYDISLESFRRLEEEYYKYLCEHSVSISERKLVKSFNERYK